ncbi:ATP-binding cassette domain-containing protein [Enterococcus alcedinis]|uniref:Multidrug ABC transporter ATP-binding protein n=1 Tax=Enterococcus alcedinis TaxID=1274384 RepID=A0A917N417_9ENTE|nr:ATP-binding cassette domain-containing protein [Enterococcus alcedinis]MBP2101605.1 ABC-2 type transport system ATP-binding protein [Enterococcus alcedinis]GGI65001.1 multidrug ABC transporter ATP-binding protein [Enterococcus alcedinis]
MSYLKVTNVCVELKRKTIVRNVNVNGELGQVLGFVGENGSGKTILFKAICGFVKIKSGEIQVGEERIGEDVDFPSNTGILIENPGFIPSMTGFDNLYSLALLMKGVSKKDILNLLDLVGLIDNKDIKFSKYSLGMKQRLGIAQALMGDPNLVILDEPFNGLDNQGIELLIELILQLKKENKLVLLTSHRNEDLEKVCDKFYKVQEGNFSVITGEWNE